MATYLVYRRHELNDMLLSKLKRIAEAFEIDTTGMTRTQIRDAVLNHDRNKSPVPHPLIKVPV